MSNMAACLASIVLIAGVTSFAACKTSHQRPATAPGDGTPSSSAGAAGESESAEPPVTSVNATVVVAECPDAAKMNNRAAQLAIHRLVDPCAGVPGGKAHFSATLLPGGRIELASPEGDPSEGVVPTCVLKNNLIHHVYLKKACKFDVQLEERTGPAQ